MAHANEVRLQCVIFLTGASLTLCIYAGDCCVTCLHNLCGWLYTCLSYVVWIQESGMSKFRGIMLYNATVLVVVTKALVQGGCDKQTKDDTT